MPLAYGRVSSQKSGNIYPRCAVFLDDSQNARGRALVVNWKALEMKTYGVSDV